MPHSWKLSSSEMKLMVKKCKKVKVKKMETRMTMKKDKQRSSTRSMKKCLLLSANREGSTMLSLMMVNVL